MILNIKKYLDEKYGYELIKLDIKVIFKYGRSYQENYYIIED